MMKKVKFPIPTQIIEIIGEHNAADIYKGESSEENSEVEVWQMNVKSFRTQRSPNKAKRDIIHNHLKTLQGYYLSKPRRKSQSVPGTGRSKSTEGESGYDSKDAVSSTKVRKITTRRKAEMPRATPPCSPSSQSDMFSTPSPVKVNSVGDSIPKKKVVRTLSAVKKDSEPKIETSSSENESESERIPRINISPFVSAYKDDTMVSNRHSKNTVGKRGHSVSDSDSVISDENEIPEHQQPPHPNPKNSSGSDSSSNSSDNESEKSPRSTVMEEDLNESNNDDSEADSTSHGSVRQAKVTLGNESSGSDSDQSEQEIIPATQDVSQGSKNVSLSGIGVGDLKGSKFGSPSKPLKRENRSPSQDIARSPNQSDYEASKTLHSSSSPSKSQPIRKSRRESVTYNTSDSEDDKDLPKVSPSTSDIPIPQRTESSWDDSDSIGTESSTKNNKETASQRIVPKSIHHSSDSEDTDDTNKTDLSNPHSIKPTEKELSPSSTIVTVDGNVHLPNQNSTDSSATSESDDSDQEASPNAKLSLSPIKNQTILPRGKESRGNSSSDSDDRKNDQLIQRSTSQSNNSRKSKTDSVSSSDESDNEPKINVRKTIGTTENVPFNSTRNPGVDETGFPGSDISVIPKMDVPLKPSSATVPQDTSSTANTQNPRSLSSKSPSAPPTKGPGSRFGQLSIREFARPINPVNQIGTQNKYEALKQEYFDAGFSNLKEQYDFESYEGLLEEDLLDNDIEVYVVQCPKEVDPTSLVGQEIDVSNKESVVELTVTGGKTVRHDVYCDLSDSEFGVNVIIPSRTKKKFTLNALPVNGRLTIVESVDVPQIDEFDSSSPPHVPFPENLKARNTFVESDESAAQTILKKPNKNKSRKAGNSNHQGLASLVLDTYETPKYEPVYKNETSGQKLKSRHEKNKDHGQLDDSKIKIDDDEPSVAEPLQSLKTENLEVIEKKKKKKKKHEENEHMDVPVSVENLKEELFASPPEIPVEENIVKKKKKKKKRELEEPNDDEPSVAESLQPLKTENLEVIEKKKKKKKKHEENEHMDVPVSVENVKEELFASPPEIPVEENIVKKKKKKKKRELEEPNGLIETLPTVKEEILPLSIIGVPVEEPVVERKSKKKKKKKHEVEELIGSTELLPTVKEVLAPPPIYIPVEEPIVEKKKKKRKRELEELNESTESLPTVKDEFQPHIEEPCKKKKKKRHLDEHSIGVGFNSDEDVTSKKKKKKKKKKENQMDED